MHEELDGFQLQVDAEGGGITEYLICYASESTYSLDKVEIIHSLDETNKTRKQTPSDSMKRIKTAPKNQTSMVCFGHNSPSTCRQYRRYTSATKIFRCLGTNAASSAELGYGYILHQVDMVDKGD